MGLAVNGYVRCLKVGQVLLQLSGTRNRDSIIQHLADAASEGQLVFHDGQEKVVNPEEIFRIVESQWPTSLTYLARQGLLSK